MEKFFSLRTAKETDILGIREVFKESILSISEEMYSKEQKIVWSNRANDKNKWQDLIETQFVVIAEVDLDQIVGFSSLNNNSLIDMLFVKPHFQNAGIATALYNEIESHAKWGKVAVLSSFASKVALPFFLKKGFVVKNKNVNILENVELINYEVYKRL